MTPSEIRALLSRVGKTQTGGARLIGVGPRTMRRWLDTKGSPSQRDMPRPCVLLLRSIEEVPGMREWLEKQAA